MLKKNIFLKFTGRKKSPVCEKKEATDLKIIFLKSPKKMYVKPVTIGCQFRKNTFLPFLDFDSTFPSAQTINVISLIFLMCCSLKKSIYEYTF